jgi:hypothetical protein
VPEEDRFVPGFDGIAVGFEGDEPDGRGGRFGELRFGCVGDMGARGEFDLFGGKFHRES